MILKLKGNNTYTLKKKNKAKDYKKSLTFEAFEDREGGLWLSPQAHKILIPRGANPSEALQIAIRPILQFYPEVKDLAREFYNEFYEINDDFFERLKLYFRDAGWTIVYDGEIDADVLTDKLVKRLKEPLRGLNWNKNSELDIIERDKYGNKVSARLPLIDFITSNSARQVLLKSREYQKNKKLKERTYKELYDVSDNDRKVRAKDVQVRPPQSSTDQYGNSLIRYNFKSKNSTTGKRQKGYITFLSGDVDEGTSPVEVYCSCPDFKYRYAYTNWKDKSAPKPSDPLNRRFPDKTNPSGEIGMCKHLLAAKDYIVGLDFY